MMRRVDLAALDARDRATLLRRSPVPDAAVRSGALSWISEGALPSKTTGGGVSNPLRW